MAPALVLVVSAALVAGLTAALRVGVMPLGVRGEWEWLRISAGWNPADVLLACAGVAAFAAFAGVGTAALRRSTIAREAIAVVALAASAVLVQLVAHLGAPDGYGLAKWVISLQERGSSGYFRVAREQVHDPSRFLAEYPSWIRRQDALHIGTHPPGLIVSEAVLLRILRGSPRTTRFVLTNLPDTVERAFRVVTDDGPLSSAERATLALTGFFTLLACALTVVPLYLLARACTSAPESWAAAALWPLVPSAILFQPTADAAFPLLSTTALAFAAHAVGRAPRTRRLGLACSAGLVLAVGMQFTLAFLPVGLVVAVVLCSDRETQSKEKLFPVLATGFGFLALTLAFWAATGADPFVIWWWNQKNHSRFYLEYPRSYRAWVVANPVELAIAMGLPVTAWACLAATSPREAPRVSLATAAVLALLTIGGKTLSEVARIWLPFMPALLVAAGWSMGRLGAGPKSVAATVAMVGAQTLVLEATIQVVYPIEIGS